MLDFKGWSKVKEDKQSVTMKHKDGHTMTLAMGSLPKIQKEALKRIKLAEGTPDEPIQAPSVDFDQTLNQTPQAQPVPIPSPAPAVTPNGEMNAQGVLKQANQAADLQQSIDQEKGRQTADIQKGYLDRANEIQNTRNTNAQMLWKNQMDIVNGMKNGDINPNHYMESMGSGKRVGTALSLFLGGVNGNANNGAMQFLNQQIANDIDAQKQNFEHKKTVFGAYQQLYNNNDVSANMARAASLDALMHQADYVTASLATPQAAANNLALKSKLIPERNKLILDSAGLLSSTPNGSQIPKSDGQAGNAPVRKGPASEYVKAHLKQMENENTPMGMEGAEASTPNQKQGLPADDYADSPILKPGAQIWQSAPEDLKHQFTQAQQADQILSQLHEVHQSLAKDTKSPDYSYARRHNPLQGVPFMGEALSHALLQPISDNQTNRDYQANRTRIVSDVANAVGSNVPGAEIERMVDDNLPEVHDTPKMIAQKERNIRIFIKNHVPKSMLKTWKQSD